MKTSNVVLLVASGMLSLPGIAAEPPDLYPPVKIGDGVDDGISKFRYASDVEEIPGTLPKINHWICNEDTKGTRF